MRVKGSEVHLFVLSKILFIYKFYRIAVSNKRAHSQFGVSLTCHGQKNAIRLGPRHATHFAWKKKAWDIDLFNTQVCCCSLANFELGNINFRSVIIIAVVI